MAGVRGAAMTPTSSSIARRPRAWPLVGRAGRAVSHRPRACPSPRRRERRALLAAFFLALTFAVAALPIALLEPPVIELDETESADASSPPLDPPLRPRPPDPQLLASDPALAAHVRRVVVAPRAAELFAAIQPRGQPVSRRPGRSGHASGIPP